MSLGKFSYPKSLPTLIAALAVAGAAVLPAGCGKDKAISGRIASLNLENYSGEKVEVDFTRNHATLLVFWATWCQPCIMEIPSLMMLHEKFKDRSFQVVSINVDDPEGGKVRNIAGDFGINYPLLKGGDGVMQRFGGIMALPTSFLIDREGRIVEKIQGLMPESELEKRVVSVLDSKS